MNVNSKLSIGGNRMSTITLFQPQNTERTYFGEEHIMFRNSLRKFLEKEAIPYFEKWEEERIVPRSFWKKLGDNGFLSPSVSEEYGGVGGDFAMSIILSEELGRIGAGLAGPGTHSNIIVPYIESFGTEEQKHKYLPGCVSGEIITAIAMTEPGTGSDLANISTTAIKDGDHYVINGQKTFITNGIHSDLVVVACKTDPHANPKHKGVSLLLVEEGTPGFSKGKKLNKVGMHAQDTSELIFEDVKVPVSNLLGEEGQGFKYLMSKLQQERILAAIDRLIVRHQNGEDIVTEVSMAKWWITDMARRISSECMQLHGGYGYMEEYKIARRYRDIAVSPIFAGTNEIMKVIIAKNLGL